MTYTEIPDSEAKRGLWALVSRQGASALPGCRFDVYHWVVYHWVDVSGMLSVRLSLN